MSNETNNGKVGHDPFADPAEDSKAAVARKLDQILDDPEFLPPGPEESGSRYARQAMCGEGGMGRVWQAEDTHLGRLIALKEPLPEAQTQPQLRRRFLNEARVTAQLQHPGIAPVYELIERPDEPPYYTMRLVCGRTLSEAVRDFSQKQAGEMGDPVALRDLLQAFVSVCQTLAYAHARGVIHRDLKGANIILGSFGEVIVLDWGMARVLGVKDEGVAEPHVQLASVADLEQTRAGVAIGTPAYMSPEQAQGRVDLIDRRTDVFGLGAVLYEILTGRPPHASAETTEQLQQRFGLLAVEAGRITRAQFDEALAACLARPEVALADLLVQRNWISSADREKLQKWLEHERRAEVLRRPQECKLAAPRQLASWVPRPLEAICLKALAKQREDRYQKALELADEVKRWLSGEPVRACPEPWSARVKRWVGRHRTLTTAMAVAALVALLIGGGSWRWMVWQTGIQAAKEEADAKDRATKVAALLEGAESLRQQSKRSPLDQALGLLDQALAAAKAASGMLTDSAVDEKPRRSVASLVDKLVQQRQQVVKDRQMRVRLGEARLSGPAAEQGGAWNWAVIDTAYARAFAWYGIDVKKLSGAELAERILVPEIDTRR